MAEPRRDAQERTEANVPRGEDDHVPYAQMDAKESKKKAPGIDEHDAAGQGLSG